MQPRCSCSVSPPVKCEVQTCCCSLLQVGVAPRDVATQLAPFPDPFIPWARPRDSPLPSLSRSHLTPCIRGPPPHPPPHPPAFVFLTVWSVHMARRLRATNSLSSFQSFRCHQTRSVQVRLLTFDACFWTGNQQSKNVFDAVNSVPLHRGFF